MTLRTNPKILGTQQNPFGKNLGMEGTFCVYISVFPMNEHRCQKHTGCGLPFAKIFGTSGPEELHQMNHQKLSATSSVIFTVCTVITAFACSENS